MNCSVSNDATGPALFGCAPGLLEMASRLNEAPDVPFEDTFFARAYSMSNDGWVMTWATLILTALLELMSMDEVRKVCKREGGRTRARCGRARVHAQMRIASPTMVSLPACAPLTRATPSPRCHERRISRPCARTAAAACLVPQLPQNVARPR